MASTSKFFWKRRKLAQKHICLEYPIPEIPDVFENKSGMDRVLPKIIGSGRVSGTRQALPTGDIIQLAS